MKNKSQRSVRQNREDQAAGLVIKSIYLSSFSENQMTSAWNKQVKRQFTKECHRDSERAKPRRYWIQTETLHELKWEYAQGVTC